MGTFFSIAFNMVAVILVWKTNNMWVDLGVILLQILFIFYQISENVENN